MHANRKYYEDNTTIIQKSAAPDDQGDIVQEQYVAPQAEDPLAFTLRKAVVEKVKEWVDSMPEPDAPFITSATESGDAELISPRQVVSHIEKRTDFGEQVIQNWVGLLVKNIKDIPL